MNLGNGYGQDFVTGTKKCLTNNQGELMVAEKNTTSASEMFTEVLDYTSTVHAVAVGTCSLTVVAVGVEVIVVILVMAAEVDTLSGNKFLSKGV